MDTRWAAMVPGGVAIGLFIVWAEHDGGFDDDTWYWGALLCLALVTLIVVSGTARLPRPRAARIALGLFALYVCWSYLSMTWASAPGVALEGSNRTLLYFLVFTLMLIVPWSETGALVGLLIWTIGIGALAVWILARLAAADNLPAMLVQGRLATPTGYLNATGALFTMGLLSGVGLAVRRRLPAPLRGLLLALACAELQLALIVQSRGWLFTLPLVVLAVIALATDRLRWLALAILPLAGAAAVAHRSLAVYGSSGSALSTAAARAGRAGLLAALAVLLVGIVVAWRDRAARGRVLSAAARRTAGWVAVVLVVVAAAGGAILATHGHPVRFADRQLHGFSHQEPSTTHASHFDDVGSGRYDFWRVAVDAFLAHPVGGLGQDNFDDYYIPRGRTSEEPRWTHSLELRLLAHTGLVGLLLFGGFVVAAIAGALGVRRRGGAPARSVVAIALVPLIVWLIHGSIDWFWEMPALSGPALGLLGMAASLAGAGAAQPPVDRAAGGSRPPDGRSGAPVVARLATVAGALVLVAATVTLGLPYLATRLTSIASDVPTSDPSAALADLHRASQLDPLSSTITRTAGEIALGAGRNRLAAARFDQSLSREPDEWLSELGAGLAASALGQSAVAERYFRVASRLDRYQPPIPIALQRVRSSHPLTWNQALPLFKTPG